MAPLGPIWPRVDIEYRKTTHRQIRLSPFDCQTGSGFRSKLRYCTASDTCSEAMASLPARSAIVRAILRIRLYALADKPSLSMTVSNNCRDTSSTWQYRFSCRLPIWALAYILDRWKRKDCLARAALTRFLMSAEDSALFRAVRSLYGTAGTSTWMSIRSRRGPEILDR